MRRLLVCATAVALAFGARTVGVIAHSAAPQNERRFEVASVKPGLSPYEAGRLAGQGGTPMALSKFGIGTQPGGRFTAGATLKQLIAEAFDVKDYHRRSSSACRLAIRRSPPRAAAR